MKPNESLRVSISDAFELGRKEGLKEAFLEIKKMLGCIHDKSLSIYVEARLKSILDFENKNPFKKAGADEVED